MRARWKGGGREWMGGSDWNHPHFQNVVISLGGGAVGLKLAEKY